MNKISPWFIFFAFLVGLAAMWIFFSCFYQPSETVTVKNRKNNHLAFLKLPKSKDADVFGPEYWKAFHALANMIPCGVCRADAIPLEIFKHDIVNLKLEKPLYDKKNWKEWVKKVNELDKKV